MADPPTDRTASCSFTSPRRRCPSRSRPPRESSCGGGSTSKAGALRLGQDAGAATAAEVAPREPGRPDRQHDDKLFFFEPQERGTLNDFERAQVRRMRTAAASPLGCCSSCCCIDDVTCYPRAGVSHVTQGGRVTCYPRAPVSHVTLGGRVTWYPGPSKARVTWHPANEAKQKRSKSNCDARHVTCYARAGVSHVTPGRACHMLPLGRPLFWLRVESC